MKYILTYTCIFFLYHAVPVQEKPAFSGSKVPLCCESNIPVRFKPEKAASAISHPQGNDHGDMVWIGGGSFMMGGDNQQASPDEFPKHKVIVDGFWMDQTEVINGQFAKFVAATGYLTTSERKPDWEQLKTQVPPGTPKPNDSLPVLRHWYLSQQIRLCPYMQ